MLVLLCYEMYMCVYMSIFIERESVIFPTRIMSNHISLAYFGICSRLLSKSITNPEKMIFCGGAHVKAGFIRGRLQSIRRGSLISWPLFCSENDSHPTTTDGGTHPNTKLAFQAAFGIWSTLLGGIIKSLWLVSQNHNEYLIYFGEKTKNKNIQISWQTTHGFSSTQTLWENHP